VIGNANADHTQAEILQTLAALKDSLEALRDSKQKLRIEYEALGTEYARQSAAHANVLQSLKSDLVAIQERYTRLESVLQCRDETLAAVYASRAWRVAMMASDFARRFPRLSEFAEGGQDYQARPVVLTASTVRRAPTAAISVSPRMDLP